MIRDAEAITINNKGGILSVVSRVSDKIPGDTGHPIRFDSTNGQWYVNVATAATANTIYSTLSNLGTASLGEATSRTFIKRTPDTRNIIDTTYRLRYVIPADSATTARPPFLMDMFFRSPILLLVPHQLGKLLISSIQMEQHSLTQLT